jgi:putative flippase GtrA
MAGRLDILRRVEIPSELGVWSYEVMGTKLTPIGGSKYRARSGDRRDLAPYPGVSSGGMRHYVVFMVVGLIAFAVDASILSGLTSLIGIPALVARIFAISIAMVVSWMLHRSLTFAVKSPPTFLESVKFAASSWIAAATNYTAFAAILITSPRADPLVALVISSLVAALVGYIGMRFRVFTH